MPRHLFANRSECSWLLLQKNHLSTAAPQITKNQISSCHVIAGLEAASISIKEKKHKLPQVPPLSLRQAQRTLLFRSAYCEL